jgi:hypothetical protein
VHFHPLIPVFLSSLYSTYIIFLFFSLPCIFMDRDSSVGIATGYGLDGPGIESRWGATFSTHVQTVPGAHPAYLIVNTGSLFLG